MTGRRHERGLALIVVLWVIAALSLIAGAMLATSMTSAKIERNAWTQLEVRTAADTAVQGAILTLFDPAGPALFDGRTRRSAAGDVSITLSVQSQRGLVDINYAGPGLLKSLFKANGVDAATADTLADRIVDWRSPPGTQRLDHGADSADPAYRPRHGPFQSLEELRLVAGITPDIYNQVAPALTVYSHRADFDMRQAPREVLLVIPGMSSDNAKATVAARKAALAQSGTAFVIVARARKNQMEFSRRAAVLLTGDPAQPYKILDWR